MTDEMKSSSTISLKFNLCPSSQPVDPETAVRRTTRIVPALLGFALHPHPHLPPFSCVLLRELDLYSGPGTDSDMSGLRDKSASAAHTVRPCRCAPSPRCPRDLDDLELNMELTRHRPGSATPVPALPLPIPLPVPQLHRGAHGGPTASARARPRERADALPPTSAPRGGAPAIAARRARTRSARCAPLAGVPPADLETLLALRARAAAALTPALATASTSTAGGVGKGTLEYEPRRSVPRDAGDLRKRRKRVKEVGREVGGASFMPGP
ncbi:hypothetical protein FB451DRAFT_1369059 [Mycena latifolia]|nr:hypothetical protein FB451DRAFT_1369059 [Mycena latifolia]